MLRISGFLLWQTVHSARPSEGVSRTEKRGSVRKNCFMMSFYDHQAGSHMIQVISKQGC